MASDPRRRETLANGAATAYRDAHHGLSGRRIGQLHNTSQRSASRWRQEGPPVLLAADRFIWCSPDPWRIAAHMTTTAKMVTLEKMSRPELIARYREVLAHEPMIEAGDRELDMKRNVPWAERAAASERDVAINAEKAAIEWLFAEYGIPEAEVLGRRGH